MNYVCPKCYKNIEKIHVSGLTAYCSCGHVSNIKIKKSLTQKAIAFLRYCLLLFLIAGVGAIFIYHRKNYYSADTNYMIFKVKHLFIEPTEEDLLDMGKICNSYQAFKCSVHIFEELYKKYPNTIYLANYINSLYQTNQYKKADPLYNKFLEKSHVTYDLYYAKAKSLRQRNLFDEAISHYYAALSLNPEHKKTLMDLADLFIEQRNYLEAHALIKNYRSHYVDDKVFKSRIDFLEKKLEETMEQKDIRHYRVAAFNNHFFIPVKLKKDGYRSFLIDTGASSLTLNTIDLKQSKISYKNLGRVKAKVANDIVDIDRVILANIKIGPWEFKNVEALHCNSCSGLVGMNILSQLTTKINNENGVKIMELKKTF